MEKKNENLAGMEKSDAFHMNCDTAFAESH